MEKTKKSNSSKRLLDFIKNAVSPYHTVEEIRKKLEEAGFSELEQDKEWKVKPDGKYFCIPFKTALFAFTIPSIKASETSIHIAAAHTDFPCLQH